MNRLRPTPWSWRQAERSSWKRPAPPPSVPIGVGEVVAYSVYRKCGPMPAVALEVAAGWAKLLVTWLPTKVQTIRAVPCADLRPWTSDDDDYWLSVKARQMAEKARHS